MQQILSLCKILLFVTVILIAHGVRADDCERPDPVCTARAAVFPISAFDPMASATRIGEDLLVTSHHAVADQRTVTIHLADNQKVTARVIASGYRGDLILLESDELPDGQALPIGEVAKETQVYSVGVDLGRREIRAYAPGSITFLPDRGHPLARLHHTAFSQPGNSGGALVNANGQLVGIIASGGEGRYEAVPATDIARLKMLSGEQYQKESMERSAAIRICTLKLEEILDARKRSIDDQDANALATSCRRSSNRQLFEQAGQILGRFGRFEASIEILAAAVREDPNAINSRISLIVSQSIAGRYEDSLAHIRWLLDHNIYDFQVLRFGIQSGVWGGDKELALRAYERLVEVNPQAAPTAKRFLDEPPQRPRRR